MRQYLKCRSFFLIRGSTTEDFLVPSFDDAQRSSSTTTSVFSLACTVLGGGILSLPFALAKAGLVAGLLLIWVSAALSAFTGYILIAATRRTSTDSFGGLAEAAFGVAGNAVTTSLLLLLCFGCCVAYIVLAGQQCAQLWVGLIDPSSSSNSDVDLYARLGCTFLVLPLCFFRNLSKLRHASNLVVLSSSILAVVVAVRSVQGGEGFSSPSSIKLWPDSAGDLLYTLPFFFSSFLCHFNIPSMQTELLHPTRRRIQGVLWRTMVLPAVLYSIVGAFGYLYSLQGTCDNILANFSLNDAAASVCRVCITVSLLLSFPLLVLPCRNALESLEYVLSSRRESLGREESAALLDVAASAAASPLLMESGDADAKMEGLGDGSANPKHASSGTRRAALLYHVARTCAIVLGSLAVACTVPGVATIWSVLGSTASILIAFVLPSALYLKVRARAVGWKVRTVTATIVLAVSLAMVVACTITAAIHASDNICPSKV